MTSHTSPDLKELAMAYEEASYALQADQTPAFEELDREFERLDALADALRHRLSPVLRLYVGEVEKLATPKPEPSSHIRGRIERLRDIGQTFDRILSDIDL